MPQLSKFMFVVKVIFRISRSPSSFKVIGLISRSQKQKSWRAHVCASLGHSLFNILCITWVFWLDQMHETQIAVIGVPIATMVAYVGLFVPCKHG